MATNNSSNPSMHLLPLPSISGGFLPTIWTWVGLWLALISRMSEKWSSGISELRPYRFCFCSKGNPDTCKEVWLTPKKREKGHVEDQRHVSGTSQHQEKRVAQPPRPTAGQLSHPSWGSGHKWALGCSSSSPSWTPPDGAKMQRQAFNAIWRLKFFRFEKILLW